MTSDMSDTARLPPVGDLPAYDPSTRPELFFELRRRRIMAWLIDVLVILALVCVFGVLVFFLGILTLGLGWSLFAILGPAVAILYAGTTIGTNGATFGMRAMGLRLRMWYGGAPDFWIGCAHAVLFWVSTTILPLLSLVPPLLDRRKRMLHDMIVGVVMIDDRAGQDAF
jgi:uncharacterized RDD family membrane protein YckC